MNSASFIIPISCQDYKQWKRWKRCTQYSIGALLLLLSGVTIYHYTIWWFATQQLHQVQDIVQELKVFKSRKTRLQGWNNPAKVSGITQTIAQIIPNDCCLKQLTIKKRKCSLRGQAYNDTAYNEFLKLLQAHTMYEVITSSTKYDLKNKLVNFTIYVKLT